MDGDFTFRTTWNFKASRIHHRNHAAVQRQANGPLERGDNVVSSVIQGR